MQKQPSSFKRGNGSHFMHHQQKISMAYNIINMKGGLNGETFENLDFIETNRKFSNSSRI